MAYGSRFGILMHIVNTARMPLMTGKILMIMKRGRIRWNSEMYWNLREKTQTVLFRSVEAYFSTFQKAS